MRYAVGDSPLTRLGFSKIGRLLYQTDQLPDGSHVDFQGGFFGLTAQRYGYRLPPNAHRRLTVARGVLIAVAAANFLFGMFAIDSFNTVEQALGKTALLQSAVFGLLGAAFHRIRILSCLVGFIYYAGNFLVPIIVGPQVFDRLGIGFSGFLNWILSPILALLFLITLVQISFPATDLDSIRCPTSEHSGSAGSGNGSKRAIGTPFSAQRVS